jgi:glycerophosphoryl diester phosphodiesterase
MTALTPVTRTQLRKCTVRRRSSNRRLLAVASTVWLFACSSNGGAPALAGPCPPSPYHGTKMLVIAHAGGEGLGPANTIEAMRLSMAAGADVNDADIHLTADGMLVAMHDDTVDATTNGKGFVRAKTLAELQNLDAGVAFAGPKNDFPFRGKGVKIPTIEQVLTDFPERLTSLEFKDDDGPAPEILCALLRRLDRTKNVYLSSDQDPAIEQFKLDCPEVATTVTDAMVPIMRAAQASGEAWCSPVPIGQPPYNESRKPTKATLKWSHDHGLANFTWTVDDPETIRYLAKIGMDAVYTRRPDLARKIVDDVSR